jgi:hypothetical protein
MKFIKKIKTYARLYFWFIYLNCKITKLWSDPPFSWKLRTPFPKTRTGTGQRWVSAFQVSPLRQSEVLRLLKGRSNGKPFFSSLYHMISSTPIWFLFLPLVFDPYGKELARSWYSSSFSLVLIPGKPWFSLDLYLCAYLFVYSMVNWLGSFEISGSFFCCSIFWVFHWISWDWVSQMRLKSPVLIILSNDELIMYHKKLNWILHWSILIVDWCMIQFTCLVSICRQFCWSNAITVAGCCQNPF